MTDPLPPRYVAIAGSLVLATGIFVLSHIPTSSESVPFMILGGAACFTVGWGMFVGRKFPWGWGAVIGLFVLLQQCGILNEFRSGQRGWSHPDSLLEVMFRVLAIVLALYVFFTGTFGKAEEWSQRQADQYGKRPKASPETKRLVACVVVISVIFSFLYQAKDWGNSETLRRVYEIETRLIPYDDETGEPIEEISFSNGQKHPGDRKRVTLPYFNAWEETITEGGQPRKTVVIKGFASNSFPAVVSSSGYEGGGVMLDRDSPAEIRVPLKRKK